MQTVQVRVVIQLPTYSEISAAGATLRMFTCETHDLRLSTDGCAKRYRTAVTGFNRQKHGGGPRREEHAHALDDQRGDHLASLQACARCPLGQVHSGVAVQAVVQLGQHFGAELCPRCGQGGARMIAGRVCVSCYNRERELAAGKNARGNAPDRVRRLHPVRLHLVVDNGVRVVEDRATGTEEVVCRTLRNTRGQVAFAPAYRALAPIQLELRFG